MSEELARNLDLKLAWKRVKADIFTLKRVFIKHPYEITLIERDLEGWLSSILDAIRGGEYNPSPMYVCDVPKAKGLVRPGSHLSLSDRVVYTACIGACQPEIIRALAWSQGTVDFSYRLNLDPKAPQWFRNRFAGWQDFRARSLSKIDEGVSYVIIADISGYYENIDINMLISDLHQIGAPTKIINQLSTCLNRWAQIGGRGIPQGQSASDILGKLYLNNLDQTLKDMGYIHYRYVDDIRIFCRNQVEAKKALMELVRLLRKRGLNLQTAKTDIHRASKAKEVIVGLTGIIKVVRSKFIDDIVDLLGLDDPYLSISDAENKLSNNIDDTPVEIIKETYRAYFLDPENGTLDRTLFRFLLKRLGNLGDKFAVEHCKTLFTRHPEETHTILDYFKSCDAFEEVIESILAFFTSEDAVYVYQKYQIIEWISELSIEPPASLVGITRGLTFDSAQPHYLRSACMKLISDYGTVADLERIETCYPIASSSLEQSQIMCCLTRMERGRRNAFLARAQNDGELNKRAAEFVRSSRD